MKLYSFLSHSCNPNFNKIISDVRWYTVSCFSFTDTYSFFNGAYWKLPWPAIASLSDSSCAIRTVVTLISHFDHVQLQIFHLLFKKCPVDYGCIRILRMLLGDSDVPCHQHREVLFMAAWTAYVLLVFLLLIDSKKQQGHKMQRSPEKSLSVWNPEITVNSHQFTLLWENVVNMGIVILRINAMKNVISVILWCCEITQIQKCVGWTPGTVSFTATCVSWNGLPPKCMQYV